ncbi:MAG: FAD-binding oxidoreductase [Candidatus Competibacterales bacterium]
MDHPNLAQAAIDLRYIQACPTQSKIEAALVAWQQLLGPQGVRDDPTTRHGYSRSTSNYSTRPRAILFPQTEAQVAQIVAIARAKSIPLYPISAGCNWGYSDACAVTDHQVIVDLCRMNGIRSVDETLAYAVIEPGVTQQQLSEHLRTHYPTLWMDCTGAGPHTSLVGNILERGFGHSPYGDRTNHIAGLRVVLPNGRILATGFGHFAGAKATHLYPHGIGPALQGLFAQSNFGIVTSLGLWLMRRPEQLTTFLCVLPDDELLGPTVDALRELRLEGVLRSAVHLGNDLRAIASQMSFPHHLQDRPPLGLAVRHGLRRELGIGAWTLSGGLYGTKAQVRACAKEVRARLRGRGRRLIWLDAAKLDLGQGLLGHPIVQRLGLGRSLRAKLDAGRALYDIHRGIPSPQFLAGAFWRHPQGVHRPLAADTHPARAGCGLRWLSPVIPMEATDVTRATSIAHGGFQAFGFDGFMTLTTLNERSLVGIFNLAFDPNDPDEVARSEACYEKLSADLAAAGYYPYRASLSQMATLDRHSQGFWPLVRQIKQTLDPTGILAPGRYDPPGPGGRPFLD